MVFDRIYIFLKFIEQKSSIILFDDDDDCYYIILFLFTISSSSSSQLKMKILSKKKIDFLFTTFNRLNEEEQKWIIIGAGLSALILLALIQLFCMFCTSCNCCCGNDGGGPNSNNNLIKQSDHMDYLNEKVAII